MGGGARGMRRGQLRPDLLQQVLRDGLLWELAGDLSGSHALELEGHLIQEVLGGFGGLGRSKVKLLCMKHVSL